MIRNLLVFTSIALAWNATVAAAAVQLPYKFYVPQNIDGKKIPAVVILHGCVQDADSFATATYFNDLAEKEKFVAIYPEQTRARNANKCFNWFETKDQKRGGEPQAILNIVDELAKKHPIDKQKVFLTGFSAGAAMATIVAACYPERFQAVAIHSGLTFKAARSMIEAFSAMRTGGVVPPEQGAKLAYACSGQRVQKPLDVFVIHGDRDNIVTPKYRGELIEQFVAYNDYLDDGARNQSLKVVDTQEMAGKTEAGVDYKLRYRSFGAGKQAVVADLQIEQLGHAWSGGRQQQYSDPRGPFVSGMIWTFFSHSLMSR